MQKHKCKLCSKSFSNGRALGGHMKSHLVSSQTQTRKRLSDSVYSSSSSSEGKSLVYSLRENPRRSSRVFNPDPESSTVYNSETESESVDPVQKRVRAKVSKKKKKSKRVFKNSESGKKQKMSHLESPEPASSVSDGSPEQDLAVCLMMLSRDSRELEIKPEKPVLSAEIRHYPELRRCLIDLNLPPPQEDDV